VFRITNSGGEWFTLKRQESAVRWSSGLSLPSGAVEHDSCSGSLKAELQQFATP
jgi:hypothetical protein